MTYSGSGTITATSYVFTVLWYSVSCSSPVSTAASGTSAISTSTSGTSAISTAVSS